MRVSSVSVHREESKSKKNNEKVGKNIFKEIH